MQEIQQQSVGDQEREASEQPDEPVLEESPEGTGEATSELHAANTANKTHQPYFEDETGSKIYKTTCLKKIFKSEPLSKDRLRRIRGMSCYTDQVSSFGSPSI